MEIRGKIIQVLPLAQGTSAAGRPWKKQEYVLETFDQYPRKVKFDFFGEKADQYPLQLGEDVVVSFDIESRSFIGRDGVERWSTDIRGWKAEKADAALAAAAAAQPGVAQPQGFAPQPGFVAPQQMGAAPAFQQPAPDVTQFAGEMSPNDSLPF